MDFLHDALSWGRKLRTLSIEDAFTREMLAIEVDASLPALRVIRVLEQLRVERGLPGQIIVDNGAEFTSKALDQWAYENHVQLHFITPGRPMENGFIESFHGEFREECLNEHWFLALDDARETIESWRIDYNQVRTHSALAYRTPEEFARAMMMWKANDASHNFTAPRCDGDVCLSLHSFEKLSPTPDLPHGAAHFDEACHVHVVQAAQDHPRRPAWLPA